MWQIKQSIPAPYLISRPLCMLWFPVLCPPPPNVSMGTTSPANIHPLLSLLLHIQFNPSYHIQSTQSRMLGLLQTSSRPEIIHGLLRLPLIKITLLKQTLFSFSGAHPFSGSLLIATLVLLWWDPRSKEMLGRVSSLSLSTSSHDNNHERAPVLYILSCPSSIL